MKEHNFYIIIHCSSVGLEIFFWVIKKIYGNNTESLEDENIDYFFCERMLIQSQVLKL